MSLTVQILCQRCREMGARMGWDVGERNGRMAPGTARLAVAFPCFL